MSARITLTGLATAVSLSIVAFGRHDMPSNWQPAGRLGVTAWVI